MGENKIYEYWLEKTRTEAREKAAAAAKPGEPVNWSLSVIKHVTGAHEARRPTVALLFLQGKCSQAQLDAAGGLKPIDCISAVEQGFVTWQQLAARGIDLRRVEAVRKQTLGRLGVKARTEEEVLAGKTDPSLQEALTAYTRRATANAAPKPAATVIKPGGAVTAQAPKPKPLTAHQVAIAEVMVNAARIEALKARIAQLKAEPRDTTNVLTDEQKAALAARNQAKGKPIVR